MPLFGLIREKHKVKTITPPLLQSILPYGKENRLIDQTAINLKSLSIKETAKNCNRNCNLKPLSVKETARTAKLHL